MNMKYILFLCINLTCSSCAILLTHLGIIEEGIEVVEKGIELEIQKEASSKNLNV